ncbi:MAG: metal-dependent hydrolase [Planctomyces sp.]|nr:metal-dependent hydrolase [Planctomyces sp.]
MHTAGKTLLFDPFFTGNPVASVAADAVNPDVILLTHGHGDHVGDVVEIAKRTGALVISNFEIEAWLQKQGVENTHSMHIGGAHKFDFGTVKLTQAFHGSMLPDGSNGGNPAGIVVRLEDGVIYHAGDTGLFSDMQLIAEESLDVAILPIGDNYTMGPEDSIRATQFLSVPNVIPCHFNTWPLIEQDADGWAKLIRENTEAEPVVLKPGEAWTLD